jgi:hypothetical protein
VLPGAPALAGAPVTDGQRRPPSGRQNPLTSTSLYFRRATERTAPRTLNRNSLWPEQRAAFVLREVFDEPYDRIAEIVGTSEQNARQLATRARRHVEERRPRFEASREQQEELAARFFAATEEGDLERLEELLAHDVVLRGDGGGKAPALARAVHGRARVARTLKAWHRAGTRFGGFTTRREEVNGQPGALFFDREGRLIAVMILDVAEGQIQGELRKRRRPGARRLLIVRRSPSGARRSATGPGCRSLSGLKIELAAGLGITAEQR